MATLFSLIFMGSFVYFIILWRQKKSARKAAEAAGTNYMYDDIYNSISKRKRIVGIVCIVSLFLVGAFSPKENTSDRSTVATTQESKHELTQEDKAKKEAEKIEKEKAKEAERIEREKKKEAEKLEKKQREEAEEAAREERRQARAREKAEKDRAEVESHEYAEINIGSMINDLESNAARANRNYKGRYVKIVGGVVQNIESDGDYITIDVPGSYGLTSIQCFPKNQVVKEQIFNLNSGQHVVVYGKVSDVGEILGYSVDLLKME